MHVIISETRTINIPEEVFLNVPIKKPLFSKGDLIENENNEWSFIGGVYTSKEGPPGYSYDIITYREGAGFVSYANVLEKDLSEDMRLIVGSRHISLRTLYGVVRAPEVYWYGIILYTPYKKSGIVWEDGRMVWVKDDGSTFISSDQSFVISSCVSYEKFDPEGITITVRNG